MMKKIFMSMLVFMFILSGMAFADSLTLGGSGGVSTYAGVYVGPISGFLNGGKIEDGVMCVEAPKTSHFGSTWGVNISTIDPVNLTNSRLGNTGLTLYQEVGYLMGQLSTHKTETGEIQFAAWRLIDPVYINSKFGPAGRNIVLENEWMDKAKGINPLEWDFSNVKIYTALDNHNQEFMSGGATQTPIPGSLLLLASGIIGLVITGQRKSNA